MSAVPRSASSRDVGAPFSKEVRVAQVDPLDHQHPPSSSHPLLEARIVAIRWEAKDILSFLLRPLQGSLPPLEPGAHIDLHLKNGLVRSYSLSNGVGDGGHYRLTIQKDATGREGSTFIHERLRVGEIVSFSSPRNTFALDETSKFSVLIAGGIGITPFIPMIARLNELRSAWRLYYCARSRSQLALLGELESAARVANGKLILSIDDENAGVLLDIPGVIAALPSDAHVYCCGPTGMMQAFRAATTGLPAERVHLEFFHSNTPAAVEGGFSVVLSRSGRTVSILPGQSILQALLEAGVDVPYSCQEGVCGACETRVISGIPDHRDLILGSRERAKNDVMMVCCSGSKSPRLVLDL